MTRVYTEMYIETPYFAENKGDILVAFRGEKGDVSWSKAITSPSSVFPETAVLFENSRARNVKYFAMICFTFKASIKIAADDTLIFFKLLS